MKKLDLVAVTLVIVGALNWGLVGAAKFNLVTAIFGVSFLSSTVFILVGLAGVYLATRLGAYLRPAMAPRTHALHAPLAVAALGIATIASVGCEAATPTAEPAKAEAPAQKDVVDTAVSAGSFKTLVAAVKAADLVDTLKGAGPFTVFAPTDEAFAKLPAGTLEMLLKPENKDKLTAILTYHVVPGKVMSTDLKDGQMAKTVNGKEVTVKIGGGKVTVGNATVAKADIPASNGVIHVIDTVLLP